MKENGLRSAYVHQLGVRMYIRELMALPNLPATHIEPAFMKLKVRCPDNDRLKRLLQYMQRTWIVSSSRTPASWSTFKRSVRTNNDAEGWHSRLNHHASHDRMNSYLLVKILHEEALLLPLQVRLVLQKKLYRHRSKNSKTKQAKLKALSCAYEHTDRTLTTSEYLRECANLADHVEE